MIPRSEIEQRISTFQKLLSNNGFSGAIIIQQADLYYYSGTTQNSHLVIPAEEEPILIVKKSLPRAKEEAKLNKIVPYTGWNDFKCLISKVIPEKTRIGFEADVIPAKIYSRYEQLLDNNTITDVSSLIRQQRMIKSPYELSLMNRSAVISNSVFKHASTVIKEGISEIALASMLEQHARQMGHQGLVRMRGFNQHLYYGHIMSGTNAAAVSYFEGPTGGSGLNPSFPQGAGEKIIKRNEPIIIDFVSVVDGYMVDQTRIFSLGKIANHLEEAYQSSLEIKETICKSGKPGVTCNDLYETAFSLVKAHGLGPYFMGSSEQVSFVGHGVGLELDELPVIAKGVKMPLAEGMVVAIEPKFVFPEEGTVGIEDTCLINKTGFEEITFFSNKIQVL